VERLLPYTVDGYHIDLSQRRWIRWVVEPTNRYIIRSTFYHP
jgi:hypothetical protein